MGEVTLGQGGGTLNLSVSLFICQMGPPMWIRTRLCLSTRSERARAQDPSALAEVGKAAPPQVASS